MHWTACSTNIVQDILCLHGASANEDNDQPLSKERSKTWTESYMEEHLRASQNKIRSTNEKLDFLRINIHQSK